MLVCNGAPQNIYGLGPRKAIIRPWQRLPHDCSQKYLHDLPQTISCCAQTWRRRLMSDWPVLPPCGDLLTSSNLSAVRNIYTTLLRLFHVVFKHGTVDWWVTGQYYMVSRYCTITHHQRHITQWSILQQWLFFFTPLSQPQHDNDQQLWACHWTGHQNVVTLVPTYIHSHSPTREFGKHCKLHTPTICYDRAVKRMYSDKRVLDSRHPCLMLEYT